MGRGQDRLAEPVEDRLVADAEPVSAHDLLGFRVPENQLTVAIGRIGVELVDVQGLAGAAAVIPEGDLAETADFPDDIDTLGSYDIQFVPRAVRLAQVPVWIEFRFQEFPVDGGNDFLHKGRFQYRFVL